MLKRYTLIFILIALLPSVVRATHLMGGEITWACQGNGMYIFTMKLYRDCNGVPVQLPVSLRVHNHPSVTGIGLSLVSQTDISPQCNQFGTQITCATGGDGAVEEFVFRSNPVNLPGIPPPQGWIFTYDNCCRNQAITNLVIDPVSTGFTLRAIMYPYNGMDESPCFDSSPVFTELPTTVICINNPFTYNHNAFDSNKDSLVYDYASPLDWLDGDAFVANQTPPNIPWNPTFSVNSPFSDPVTLDRQTGEISFTPTSFGNYVTVIRVQSYRCGQLISEIYREIQVVVIQCGINDTPLVTAPFQDPGTGQQTAFTTTVQAGDPVSFTMSVFDDDISVIGVAQTISVTASGGQFGAGFTDPNSGCPFPPCATLSPAPPVILPNNGTITFNWQTSCDHVTILTDCYVPSNTYTFIISAKDDFCPTPAYNIATVSVVVTAPPVLPPPSLRCVDVLENGNVVLTWIPVADPDGYFNSYQIYTATSPNGPFTLLDSIFVLGQSTYTHVNSGATNQSNYYYIKTRSGCGGLVLSPASEQLQSMYLNVSALGSGQIDLAWNPLSTPLLPSSTLPYRINRAYDPDPFVAYTTTTTTSYIDTMTGCLQDIFYEVFISDASGCISSSNQDGGTFSNDEAPEPPVIDSISVLLGGATVYLAWGASPSADTDAYIIYQLNGSQTTVIDTVYGLNSTYVALSNFDPSTSSISLAVSALDGCLIEGDLSVPHATMLLSYEVSSCRGSVDLSWTPYAAWGALPASYQILQQVDGNPFTVVSQVPGTTNAFEVENLIPGGNYCFAIRAISSTLPPSSTSNTVCFIANVQDLPDFAYVRNVTVLSTGEVYSACVFDAASDVAGYQILRTSYPTGLFDTLYTGLISPGVDELWFNDYTVKTWEQSYTYKYILIDKCNNPSRVSNTGRSILLQGVAMDGFVNKLQWNTYGDWDAGVGKYRLFRSIDGGSTYSNIWTSDADTAHLDVVSADVDSLMEFCYYVEAVESQVNSYGIRDTSRSNRVCVIQKPTLWIPSAFRPGNLAGNNSFKAQGLYEKLATNHAFLIFNRWGELLFATADPTEGWDGTYQSSIAPSGIYVYQLKFNLPDGSSVLRRGSVMLLD